MSWLYKGKPLDEAIIQKEYIGFIYLITQKSTGKRYIGRKMLTAAATKTVKGKKKRTRKDSDWRDYWSSSPKIKAWIEEAGNTDDFTKEILTFCHSKGSLAYCEELALYQMKVLESSDWLNDNIRSKIYRTWVKANDAINLRESLALLSHSESSSSS
jgi:hypothetical protein